MTMFTWEKITKFYHLDLANAHKRIYCSNKNFFAIKDAEFILKWWLFFRNFHVVQYQQCSHYMIQLFSLQDFLQNFSLANENDNLIRGFWEEKKNFKTKIFLMNKLDFVWTDKILCITDYSDEFNENFIKPFINCFLCPSIRWIQMI